MHDYFYYCFVLFGLGFIHLFIFVRVEGLSNTTVPIILPIDPPTFQSAPPRLLPLNLSDSDLCF